MDLIAFRTKDEKIDINVSPGQQTEEEKNRLLRRLVLLTFFAVLLLSVAVAALCALLLKHNVPQASANDTGCGDWELFKAEKCYKILDHSTGALKTFADATALCAKAKARLVVLKYPDEQLFLADFLFKKNGIVDNVWLGGQYNVDANAFNWADGSNLTFSNWAADSPKNQSDHCLQMQAGLKAGQWSDESCQKKNLVVCEKRPQLSSVQLQEELFKLMRKEVVVADEPVPVDFIYMQLPGEAPPTVIWPSFTWTDVSTFFSGVFFRVAGGEASEFGSIQSESVPKIEVGALDCKSEPTDNCQRYNFSERISITKAGGWTKYITTANRYDHTGTSLKDKYIGALRFAWQDGEVRPRNMAIRVWKRTA